MSNNKVRAFVRQCVFTETRAGKCRVISLRHVDEGGRVGKSVVNQWDMDPALYSSPEGAESLAAEIEQTALTDATGIGGPQSYVLHAYFGEAQEPGKRLTFREDGEAEDADSLKSEPPTSKGLLSQLMRHNEVTMKVAMTSLATMVTAMQRQSAIQAERIVQLENDRIENLDAMERLLQHQDDREIQRAKEEAKAKAVNEMVGTLKQVAPMVAQKLLTGNATPPPQADNKPPVEVQAIRALFESLNDDQKMKLFEMLNDDQKGMVFDLMTAFQTVSN